MSYYSARHDRITSILRDAVAPNLSIEYNRWSESALSKPIVYKVVRRRIFSPAMPLFQNYQMEGALNRRSMLILDRLLHFYTSFQTMASLLCSLAIAIMVLDAPRENHNSTVSPAASGLLTSSAITAVFSITLATMLLFRFEDLQNLTIIDFAIAWSPLFLLNLTILTFLLGLILWYGGKYPAWSAMVIGVESVVFLAGTMAIARCMWKSMCIHDGTTKAEAETCREIDTSEEG